MGMCGSDPQSAAAALRPPAGGCPRHGGRARTVGQRSGPTRGERCGGRAAKAKDTHPREGFYCYFTLKEKSAAAESCPHSWGKAPQQALYKYTHAWMCTWTWQRVRDAARFQASPPTGRSALRWALVCAGGAPTAPRGPWPGGAAWRSECDGDTNPSPDRSLGSPHPLRPARARTPRTCKQGLPRSGRAPGVSPSPCAGAGRAPPRSCGDRPPKGGGCSPPAARGRGHRQLAHFSTAPLASARLPRQAHKELSLSPGGSPLPRRLRPSPVPPHPFHHETTPEPSSLCPRPVPSLFAGVSPQYKLKKKKARGALGEGVYSVCLPPSPRVSRPLLISRHKAKKMGIISGWKILNQQEMYGLDDLWITRAPWHEKCKNIYSP